MYGKLKRCNVEVSYTILAIIILIMFNVLTRTPIQIIEAETLPTTIEGIGEKKYIDESLNQTGCLTYGPYTYIPKGLTEVTVYYRTDTDKNYFDVFSGSIQIGLEQQMLNPEDTYKTILFNIEDSVSDLEVRSYYEGVGFLEIEKIIIKSNGISNGVLLAGNLLIAGVFIITYILEKYIQRTNFRSIVIWKKNK